MLRNKSLRMIRKPKQQVLLMHTNTRGVVYHERSITRTFRVPRPSCLCSPLRSNLRSHDHLDSRHTSSFDSYPEFRPYRLSPARSQTPGIPYDLSFKCIHHVYSCMTRRIENANQRGMLKESQEESVTDASLRPRHRGAAFGVNRQLSATVCSLQSEPGNQCVGLHVRRAAFGLFLARRASVLGLGGRRSNRLVLVRCDQLRG